MKHFFNFLSVFLILIALFFSNGRTIDVHAEDDHPLLGNIISDAAIVMDYDTDQILDEKNADERIYPASMTKMMTAIVAIENLTDLNQRITITSDMLAGLAEENATVAGFKVNDTPTVQDLLYGIALPSGADASNAISFTITNNNPSAFIDMMNKKAKELGMNDTNFVNDTGLHDDNHYSTVRDMAKLLKYCLKNDTFKTIFSAKSYTTSSLASAPDGIVLESTMWKAARSGGYPVEGLIGGKTGYTIPAGHCLASWSEVNHMHILCITAHADTPIDQMTHLQDTNTILSLLKSWSKQTIIQKGAHIASVHVKHPFEEETIKVKAPETIKMDLPDHTEITKKCTIQKNISASNDEQYCNGTLSIKASGKSLYEKKIQVIIPAEKNFFGKIVIGFEGLFH